MRKIKPEFHTTKGFPRSIVCAILRDNYRTYLMTQQKVPDKDYEAVIEFFKERQKKCWVKKYKEHQHFWEFYMGYYLDLTQKQIYDKLLDDYRQNKYPKHLFKNIREALEKSKYGFKD